MDIPSDLLTLNQAAAICRSCRQTVLRWILSGRLRGIRIGHRWKVSRADLQTMIQVHTVADANNAKIRAEATRPATKGELARTEAEVDAYLRRVGIRR